jgi:hypothetical protein
MSPAKHGQMIGTPWGSRDRQSSRTRLTSGVSKIKNALAKYCNRNRESRRRADVTTTILLLIVHAVMAGGTALAPFGAIDNDACAYLHCSDQAWFSQAFGVAVLASGLLFVADLAVALLRLRRRKLAFVVPIIGCVAQVALALATYTMIDEAGLGLA